MKEKPSARINDGDEKESLKFWRCWSWVFFWDQSNRWLNSVWFKVSLIWSFKAHYSFVFYILFLFQQLSVSLQQPGIIKRNIAFRLLVLRTLQWSSRRCWFTAAHIRDIRSAWRSELRAGQLNGIWPQAFATVWSLDAVTEIAQRSSCCSRGLHRSTLRHISGHLFKPVQVVRTRHVARPSFNVVE